MNIALKSARLNVSKCLTYSRLSPSKNWQNAPIASTNSKLDLDPCDFNVTLPLAPFRRFSEFVYHTSSCCQTSNLTADLNYMQKRFYMRRKTRKIPPTKVLNFDYGGDMSYDVNPVDLAEPIVALDGAKQLQMVDELTKRLLSVEFADGQEKQKRRIHDLLSKVKDHDLDLQSLEVIIAYQTVAVRNQIRHILDNRKDKAAKSLLVRRLQARRKHLKNLRAMDLEKFTWLCEELQMKYVPTPQYNRKPTKINKVKTAARQAAFKILMDKTEAFKQKLAEERKHFNEFKKVELDSIEKEINELGLPESSQVVKVFTALKDNDFLSLDHPMEPQKSRRTAILEHKFKLAAVIKKKRDEEEAAK